MKKRWAVFLVLLLLAGCAASDVSKTQADAGETEAQADGTQEDGNAYASETDLTEWTARLFLPDEQSGYACLKEEEALVANSGAGIIQALAARGVVPDTVEVNSFEIAESEDLVSAELDLSQDFLQAVDGSGEEAAYPMAMECVVNSYLASYNLDEMIVLAGGETIPGYEQPQTLYVYD